MGDNLRADGIHNTRHKTGGRATIYDYGLVPERREAVEKALAVRPALSPFLFCNRRGQGYFNEDTGLCNGFDSMWGRFMDRVMHETKITERFTEHDLRAKAGSDAESLEKARALLQHASTTTTLTVYRRKPERV
jgi:integrase